MTPLQLTRRRPEVAAGLLAAAALAWWWTARRMSGMDAGPGTELGTLGWFIGSWAVMMAAMMLPSLAPTLALYVTPSPGRVSSRSLLFAGGYLLVWTAAGVLAYGVFELGKSLLASELAWYRGGRWLSGSVLAAAAAYEFVPLKHACMAKCRGQLANPARRSQEQWSATLLMGGRSGGWCIGSSWALMVALFALGVMSLTWMALIAALVVFEKLSPWPRAARVATAVVLVALAVGIVISPHEVPGLVVPGSHVAMHAMKAMS
jgi:predicted metal-binding membrane protein